MDLIWYYTQKVNRNRRIKTEPIYFCGLGLGGEAGEVLNELKKLMRDDHDILTEDRKQKIIEELGDVLYYMAATCDFLGVTLTDIIEQNSDKLDRLYEKRNA